MQIKTGDQVLIKPEWQDAGDNEIVWLAVDDESKGRVTIEAQIAELRIKPQQVVSVDMVERVIA